MPQRNALQVIAVMLGLIAIVAAIGVSYFFLNHFTV